MVKLLFLIFGLAGDVYADAAEGVLVHAGENDRGVGVAAAELVQLLNCFGSKGVGCGTDGKGDENLVGVQTRVDVAQICCLQMLNRLHYRAGEQRQIVGDIGQCLEGVKQQSEKLNVR